MPKILFYCELLLLQKISIYLQISNLISEIYMHARLIPELQCILLMDNKSIQEFEKWKLEVRKIYLKFPLYIIKFLETQSN